VADNSSRLDALGSSESIASDDISGVKYQRVKLTVGADGTAADVLPPADALAGSGMVAVGAMVYNGSTWDRARGNLEGTLLASAARTATTSSAAQTNYNCRGVIVYLNVTVASGTGGLGVVIGATDPASGNGLKLNPDATAVTTTGYRGYIVYPGASATSPDVVQVTASVLPRNWFVTVFHSNASSYTYSVGYSLIV
jgi:hypothetical protein